MMNYEKDDNGNRPGIMEVLLTLMACYIQRHTRPHRSRQDPAQGESIDYRVNTQVETEDVKVDNYQDRREQRRRQRPYSGRSGVNPKSTVKPYR